MLSQIANFITVKSKLFAAKMIQTKPYSSQIDFGFIESFLSKFQGGSVYLSKEYWKEGIGFIYLSHPEKKNAMSGKMMIDFRKCVSELETWKEGKAVILCGAGENFCSGGDLNFARSAGTPQEGFYMSCFMQDILKRFRKLPIVSVSLVHGPTLGGGSEISLFSDYILVADNVKLGFVQGRMGLITPWGGTTRLVQIVGERKAMEILLTSKVYNSEECLNLGLANKIVNAETRIEEALDFVRQFTVHHSSIIQSYQEVIRNTSTGKSFEQVLDIERDLFCRTWGSQLNREALEKR